MAEQGRDRTERKGSQQALEDALAYAEAIVDTVREPLVVLDDDLRVRTANRSFYRTFRVKPEQTEGRLLYDLGNQQWDIPALRKLLHEGLPRNTAFDDFEIEHDFPAIGRKVMLLNARKLYQEGNHVQLILLAIEDVTALREAERARREAETRFTEMVKNVRDHSIFLTDPDGVITSWNVAAERISGYTDAEAVGKHFSLICTPEDVEAGTPEHELRQARERGRAEDERWHRRKDGSLFWALGILTPLHDEAGRLTGFSKILRDMTGRKRPDEEGLERQRQLKFVTDHAPVLLAHIGADRRFKFVNLPYAERFGLHPRDLIGRTVRDVLGQEAYARIEPYIDAALSGRRVEYEADLPFPGIGSQTMRVAYEPERDGAGQVVGYVAAILNISDRKRTEEQLAASRSRLQALFDNTLDAILLADDQARYVDANPAACTLLGYDHDELLHRTVFDVTPLPNDEAGRAAWATFIREGQQSGEYTLHRQDGTTAVVEYRAVAHIQPGLHLSVLRDVTQRWRTEEALRQSEARLRALIDNWPSVIFVKDPQGRYLLANRACEPLAGEPVERIIGKTDYDYLPAEVADRFRADDRRVLETGEVLRYEESAPLGGELRTSLTVKFPLRAPNGQPYAVCGIATDVTDLKRTSEALRESEERFARFMHHLPGLAWVKDARGRYVYANDAAARAFGKPPEELYGRTDEEVFPPATAAQFRENDEKALAGAAGVRVVETLEHGDGVLHHSLVSKFPIPGPDGGPTLVGGMAIDITEEMRTRAVLEESEERFRATFEQAAVGIAHVGLDGRWLRVNRKLCDIVGYRPDELLGLTFQDLTHPDDLEADLAQVRQLLAGGIETFALEKRYFRKDCSLIWVNLTVALVRTPQGQPKYFISVVEDVTEQKAVRDALHESEMKYRNLFQNMAEEVHFWRVVRDGQGRVLTWRLVDANPPALKTWGKTLDQIRGQTSDEIFGPGSTDHYRAVVEKIMAERVPHAFEDYFPHLDRHFRFTSVPLGDCFITTGADITAIKKAHESLRESEKRFRELADAMPQIVYILRPGGTTEYLNHRWREYTGRDTVSDPDLPQVIHPDDLGPLLGSWNEAQSRGELFHHEFRLRQGADGEYRWFLTRAVPVRDAEGRIVKWYGTSTDIHARKQAEEALRLQTARANRLVESNIIGVIFADQERITGANDAFLAMVGYTRADLEAGRLRWREMTPPEHVPADERGLAELRQRGACTPYRKEYIRKDGSRVPVLLGATVIGPDDPSWVCFVQDMTRIKEAENELKEADRRKDEFLATLAHELRNPLAPLRNGLEVLKLARGGLPERSQAVGQAHAMMERQLAQMVRLIDDLLDVSRITRGKLRLRRERVELAGVIQSAIEGSRPLIEGAAHRLTVLLPPERVILEADATRLAQVFANLLTNAAKYTDRGGHIRLAAERRGGEVVVSVKDNGIGIAAEQLPRLFQIFSQVAPALERSQGGLGIGLSLVKGLVEMHGGSIEARSDGPGKGSEFIVRLPVEGATTAQQTQPPVRSEAGPPRPRRRILVADDNRDAADSLAMMLQLAGHEVHAAHDGREAVEAATWFRPDVALLDIGMPKWNGYEAARRIRKEPWGKEMVLVAITGWGQEEDKRRATEAGFDHHLTKPVDPADLQALLDGTRQTNQQKGARP